MQEGRDRREDGEKGRDMAKEETRPQLGGEAATTRFGMEESESTDVPATGGPIADEDEEEEERSSQS